MGLFDRFKKSQPIALVPSPTEELEEKDTYNPATGSDAEEKADSDKVSFGDLPVLNRDQESDYAALDVVADMIYRTCWPLGWMPFQQVDAEQWIDEVVLGVSIRSDYGVMRSCPAEHPGLHDFETAMEILNAAVAMKFTCRSVEFMNRFHVEPNPDLYELCLNADTRIQVLDTVSQLANARKNQYAAFIREECVLVVWADNVENLVPTARRLEECLVNFIWSGDKSAKSGLRAPLTGPIDSLHATPSNLSGREVEDPERAMMLEMRKKRPVQLISPVVSGTALGVTTVLLGLGVRSLIIRYLYDGDWTRFFLILTLPAAGLLASFPATVLVTAFVYIFGPISHYNKNSYFYSAVKPDRSNPPDELPSITIQMPVYKEDLDDVIKPTIESLKIAITTFERQGGSVNVIVCDDGLQLISEEDRAARVKYYASNNIAYVARPPHGQDGYLRRGKFKKAGNLNHCNRISLEIEGVMHKLRPSRYGSGGEATWSELDEQSLYREVVEVVKARYDKLMIPTWMDGNVRIGEIILLIDSDTRVPTDCFMDAALEMTESPQVAIIQHASGVLCVAHHFFENGMAFFTRMLQIGISMVVAGGDVAPFVGHNAQVCSPLGPIPSFLRWSALQECAFVDGFDGLKRVWSESHVSEDFQIALNVQTKGWVVRWATYSENGFEEGVSLTAADELSRWQKYAWGVSEIVFYPIKLWFKKGIFTPLFKGLISSNISTHSKWGIMAYMFSYYAFSSAWIGTIVSFILIGVFVWADTFYVDAWQTFFVCVLLFQGLNNVAMCVLRYRLHMPNAGSLAIKQLFVLPLFFTVFFSGLSIPIAAALIAHPLGIDMSWTTTSKSVEKSNFFKQLPKIFKGFWKQMLISLLALVGMVITTTSIMPVEYRVNDLTVLIPMILIFGCHLIWPFVLDPYLSTFTY